MSDGSRSGAPEEVENDLRGPFRELREYARGRLDVSHQDASRLAGIVDDPEIRAGLLFMAREYDPTPDMPSSFWETALARRALKKYGTEAAQRAIEERDQARAAYQTGLPGYERDVSGLQSINQLADWLINSEQCKVIYAAALMGRGKTDFALLLLEVVADHYRRVESTVDVEVPTPELATNFRAQPPDWFEGDVHEFHSYSSLLEWAETGSSDHVRWFIFDEASTELTAQSGANAQQVAETFAPFVKKMRKMGINMIVIGHDRKDVHPAIRSVASFIDKTGLKTAEIYEGIKRREPYGHRLTISGIPETSWTFDTDDVAFWEWDAELGDVDDEPAPDVDLEEHYREWRDQTISSLVHGTDLRQKDVAEIFGLDPSRVSRIKDDVDPVTVEPAPNSPEALAD